MEREHCTLQQKLKITGVTKEQKKLKEVMDEKYVAFLLLESMYESGKINKATYENVLKEKRNYIEEKYNLKDVTV